MHATWVNHSEWYNDVILTDWRLYARPVAICVLYSFLWIEHIWSCRMCYDDQARPPDPPGSTGGAHGEDLVLTAEDGNRFAAYLSTPVQPSSARVLIYPDVRGLHQFYKELALRFADVGIGALAIDYFGRTAGLTARNDSFEFMPHVQQLQLDTISLDVQAALARLRESSPDAQVFVVG